jgi:phospholipase D1/2
MTAPPKRNTHQVVNKDGKPYETTVTSNTWVGGATVFSRETKNNKVVAFTTGKEYFADLIQSCKAAQSEICIASWQVSWDGLLARGITLYSLLCEVVQANKSVQIYVMPWDDTEPVQTYDDQTATVLRSINERFNTQQVHVLLSPSYASVDQRYFSHHQKQAVIDRKIAYVGGLDVCYGRFDDATYDLRADAEGREALNRYNGCVEQVQKLDPAMLIDPDLMTGTWDRTPGLFNSSNAQAQADKLRAGNAWQVKYKMASSAGIVANRGATSANVPDPATLDPARQPRMPWQDVHSRIEGPAVRDLLRNFVLRWNIQATGKDVIPPVGPPADFPEAGKTHVQVLRSAPANQLQQENNHAAPDDRWPKPGTQDDIHRAMVSLIQEARRFVYIENQFFVSAFGKEAPRTQNLSPAAQFINTYGGGDQNSGAITAGKANSKGKIKWGAAGMVDRSETLKPPTNQICQALIERIGRSILDLERTPFHVYITLPVYSEGTLCTAGTAVQVYWTMQTLVFGSQSLLNGIRRRLKMRELMDKDLAGGLKVCGDHRGVLNDENKDYESIPLEKCFEYVTLLNLRNWAKVGDRYLTEQVYVHTKTMIVDDLYALVGTANVNDRSLLGERDSELAVLVVDGETKRADINGNGSAREVRVFAHELRKSVWKKLFGITGGVRPATELQQAIEHPGSPSSWNAIQKRAQQNAELYEAAFPWIPRNTIKTSEDGALETAKILPTWDPTLKVPVQKSWGQLASPQPFQSEFWDQPRHTAEGVSGLDQIKGFITALPIEWTKGETVRFEYPTALVADREELPNADAGSRSVAQNIPAETSPVGEIG